MNRFLTAILALVALTLTGCASLPTGSSLSASIKAALTPANIATATEGAITLGATEFLADYPAYAPETLAAADAFVALAQSNPDLVTAADIKAALSKTSISAQTQARIAQDAITALGLFETAFAKNLPGLKPQYSLYLIAAANGLYVANGRAALPLPPVPTPPAPTTYLFPAEAVLMEV